MWINLETLAALPHASSLADIIRRCSGEICARSSRGEASDPSSTPLSFTFILARKRHGRSSSDNLNRCSVQSSAECCELYATGERFKSVSSYAAPSLANGDVGSQPPVPRPCRHIFHLNASETAMSSSAHLGARAEPRGHISCAKVVRPTRVVSPERRARRRRERESFSTPLGSRNDLNAPDPPQVE